MEMDLFDPIKQYFTAQGFVCDGEVRDIDLYMEKDALHAAVELKENLDFRAVQQAALRQKTVDLVYIGIFTPKNIYSRSFRDRLYLLKRLGIGLITVSRRTKEAGLLLEAQLTELPTYRRRNKKEREAQSAELQRRSLKNNTGGVNGKKLMTGYREDALMVLHALDCIIREREASGEMACGKEASGEAACGKTASGEAGDSREAGTKAVREASGVQRAQQILYDNHYGWFSHAGRGAYGITEEGREALITYRDTIEKLTQLREK